MEGKHGIIIQYVQILQEERSRWESGRDVRHCRDGDEHARRITTGISDKVRKMKMAAARRKESPSKARC